MSRLLHLPRHAWAKEKGGGCGVGVTSIFLPMQAEWEWTPVMPQVLPRHLDGHLGFCSGINLDGVLPSGTSFDKFAHTWMEHLPHAGANTHPDAHYRAVASTFYPKQGRIHNSVGCYEPHLHVGVLEVLYCNILLLLNCHGA